MADDHEITGDSLYASAERLDQFIQGHPDLQGENGLQACGTALLSATNACKAFAGNTSNHPIFEQTQLAENLNIVIDHLCNFENDTLRPELVKCLFIENDEEQTLLEGIADDIEQIATLLRKFIKKGDKANVDKVIKNVDMFCVSLDEQIEDLEAEIKKCKRAVSGGDKKPKRRGTGDTASMEAESPEEGSEEAEGTSEEGTASEEGSEEGSEEDDDEPIPVDPQTQRRQEHHAYHAPYMGHPNANHPNSHNYPPPPGPGAPPAGYPYGPGAFHMPMPGMDPMMLYMLQHLAPGTTANFGSGNISGNTISNINNNNSRKYYEGNKKKRSNQDDDDEGSRSSSRGDPKRKNSRKATGE